MKKKIITITILACIVFLFIGKFILIKNYNIASSDLKKLKGIKEGLLITDLYVITTKKQEDNLKYQNVLIEKIFEEDECNIKDVLTCQNESKQKLTINITDSYLEKFKKFHKNSVKIIKNNRLESDLELFGKIKEADTKSNMLKSISANKANYILNKFCIDNIEKFKRIDLLEGDYSGLLIHKRSRCEALIYVKNKTYVFSFENFKDEEILNLINTIIIEN